MSPHWVPILLLQALHRGVEAEVAFVPLRRNLPMGCVGCFVFCGGHVIGWFLSHNSRNTGFRIRSYFHWGLRVRILSSPTRMGFHLELVFLFFFWQINDINNRRYEVPPEIINLSDRTTNTSNLNYYVEVIDKPFSIKIMRTSNKRVLWAFQQSLCVFEYTVSVSFTLT